MTEEGPSQMQFVEQTPSKQVLLTDCQNLKTLNMAKQMANQSKGAKIIVLTKTQMSELLAKLKKTENNASKNGNSKCNISGKNQMKAKSKIITVPFLSRHPLQKPMVNEVNENISPVEKIMIKAPTIVNNSEESIMKQELNSCMKVKSIQKQQHQMTENFMKKNIITTTNTANINMNLIYDQLQQRLPLQHSTTTAMIATATPIPTTTTTTITTTKTNMNIGTSHTKMDESGAMPPTATVEEMNIVPVFINECIQELSDAAEPSVKPSSAYNYDTIINSNIDNNNNNNNNHTYIDDNNKNSNCKSGNNNDVQILDLFDFELKYLTEVDENIHGLHERQQQQQSKEQQHRQVTEEQQYQRQQHHQEHEEDAVVNMNDSVILKIGRESQSEQYIEEEKQQSDLVFVNNQLQTNNSNNEDNYINSNNINKIINHSNQDEASFISCSTDKRSSNNNMNTFNDEFLYLSDNKLTNSLCNINNNNNNSFNSYTNNNTEINDLFSYDDELFKYLPDSQYDDINIDDDIAIDINQSEELLENCIIPSSSQSNVDLMLSEYSAAAELTRTVSMAEPIISTNIENDYKPFIDNVSNQNEDPVNNVKRNNASIIEIFEDNYMMMPIKREISNDKMNCKDNKNKRPNKLLINVNKTINEPNLDTPVIVESIFNEYCQESSTFSVVQSIDAIRKQLEEDSNTNDYCENSREFLTLTPFSDISTTNQSYTTDYPTSPWSTSTIHNNNSNQLLQKRGRGRPAKSHCDVPDLAQYDHLSESEKKKILERYKNNEASRKSRLKNKEQERRLMEEQEKLIRIVTEKRNLLELQRKIESKLRRALYRSHFNVEKKTKES